MLNLPLPLILPLYRMLLEELTALEARGESERIEEFLIWGRGYRLDVGSEENGTGLEMDQLTNE